MSPDDRDAAYLWDIVQATREIIEFVKDLTFLEFSKERVVRYAVERQLIVIGEAAKHLSDLFKEDHPRIPWATMIAQRNVIAHEYGEILVERIWFVAKEKLPELLREIEILLPPEPDQ